MAWTKEQDEAIHRRGESIIVSAGAGSGKTAVLSERILDYCMKGNDIRRVLVLTFTEAAAFEMKERIRKKLKENQLFEQAELIDSTYITTFDSYSLSIVKKYYYKLGLKKGISIMDGALISVKKNEIIRNLFTEYYLSENQRFLSFLKKYSLQDDKSVFKMVYDMSYTLELIVDLDTFIKNYEKDYFSNSKLDEILNCYYKYTQEEVSNVMDLLKDLKLEASCDSSSASLYDALDLFLSHISISDSYENLYSQLGGFELPRVSPKASDRVKELKKEASDSLASLKKNVFKNYDSLSSMKEEILSIKEDVLFLLDMTKEVLNRLFEYKKEVNMFGFMDIAKLLISLVKNNEEIRLELMHSYDEILVDEYQDTSDVQETFLSLIENNNRYMVGDIKQAIYRFRNANPYIFKEKYNRFALHDSGYKIDLTYNFRSRSEVLENINLLFNSLMSDDLGDANYIKDHQMQYGQKDYLKLKQDIDFNLDILSYEMDEDSTFSQAEIEAFIIAKDIKTKLSMDIKALHKDGFSPISYNDFAILISDAKEFLTFKSIFEYLNIPLSIEASLDLKQSILPTLFKNIFIVLSNTLKKNYDQEYYHALASIARSFLYEYTDEDIYRLIYLKENYPIIDDFHSLIPYLDSSYSTLFYKMNEVFHIYDSLSKIGDVDSALVVLEYMHTIISSFDELGYDIHEAKAYIKDLLDSEIKMEYKPESSRNDAVRIMTIHKSKGLEFPYVYFPLLTKGFNQADMRATVGLSKKYGIFIPFVDDGQSSTIIRSLYSKEVHDEDLSEKVRLLYVALTRAREKMILILPKREEKKITKSNMKSFADMISYANSLNSYYKDIKLEDYDISDYKLSLKQKKTFHGNMVLSYKAIDAPKIIVKQQISKELSHLPTKEERKALELGTKFHEVLEAIDFKHIDLDSMPIDSFIKETLKEVLKNDIFKNIAMAKDYHEHEFYFNDGDNTYHGSIDLMLEYEDHIDIIDYKLSNTDSIEYRRQLSIYKKYAEKSSGKKVDCYLLSLLKKKIEKIEL